MNDVSSVADLVDASSDQEGWSARAHLTATSVWNTSQAAEVSSVSAPASVSESVNGVFEPGDVLFGKLRPNLRKAVQPDFGGYCSTDMLILRPKPEHSPAFVKHTVTTDLVFRHAEANSIGTRMPRTSWSAVAEASVWLPPVAEQRRIAEILDTVDDTIAASERTLAKERLLLFGLIDERIRAVVAEPNQVRSLGELVDADPAAFIQTGPFGSQLHAVGVPGGRRPSLHAAGPSRRRVDNRHGSEDHAEEGRFSCAAHPSPWRCRYRP